METTARFKDAPWLQVTKDLEIGVIGLGGIGSHAVRLIDKSICPERFILIDKDLVEEHNIGTQFYTLTDVGNEKVYAIGSKIGATFIPFVGDIRTLTSGIKLGQITISAVDSMEIRKHIFNRWLNTNSKVLIDGRLNATSYEVFFVRKDNPKEVEVYKKSLLPDSAIPDGSCTMRQTYHFGAMIGAMITTLIANYLSNLYIQSNVYNVPFFVREMGDLVNIKTMTCESYDEMISLFV